MLRRQVAQLERARGRREDRADPETVEELAGVPVHDIAPAAIRAAPTSVFRGGQVANAWAGAETTALPFGHPEVAPLVRLDERTYVLELFHGPTLAFKDFALQLLGNLYARQCAQRSQSINVLGATSGEAITKQYGWSHWREATVRMMYQAAREAMEG